MEILNLIGRKIAEIFRLPVMLGWMLLGYGTFVAGGIYVVDRVTELGSEAEQRENREQDEEIYEAQFRAWEVKLILYTSCLSVVAGREDHRVQWEDFYEVLLPELGPEGQALVTLLLQRLEVNLPRLHADTQCVRPGDPPIPPPGVRPQSLEELAEILSQIEGG
jgi:hypothetical protein